MFDDAKKIVNKTKNEPHYCSEIGPSGFRCILKYGHEGTHLSIDNRAMWQGTPGAPIEWETQAPPMRKDPAPARPDGKHEAYRLARARGFEGVECRECGSLNTTMNGSCYKCQDCGSTTGCS